MKKSEVFRWAMCAVVNDKEMTADDKLEAIRVLMVEEQYAIYVEAQMGAQENEERDDG